MATGGSEGRSVGVSGVSILLNSTKRVFAFFYRNIANYQISLCQVIWTRRIDVHKLHAYLYTALVFRCLLWVLPRHDFSLHVQPPHPWLRRCTALTARSTHSLPGFLWEIPITESWWQGQALSKPCKCIKCGLAALQIQRAPLLGPDHAISFCQWHLQAQ